MTTKEKLQCLENEVKTLENSLEVKKSELKELTLRFEKEENVFNRIPGSIYYFISYAAGEAKQAKDYDEIFDITNFSLGNYCRDKELMQKRARHEILSRLIWRWQKIHDDEIRVSDDRYMIIKCGSAYDVRRVDKDFLCIEATHFSSKEKALECIEKVVKPFIAKNNILNDED